ncbi:MAG: hypothetical protein R3E97_03175 [Candidatus Eisenbacteria bacterium]
MPPAPKDRRARFGKETRFVTSLFERLTPVIVVPRGWKVLVECVADIELCTPDHFVVGARGAPTPCSG